MNANRKRRFALVAPVARPQGEPTIALINIVFLMLIFFLIAGTLAAPLPHEMETVRTEFSPPAAPPDALAIASDGTLFRRGVDTELAAFVAQTDLTQPVRIAADRNLPASELMGIVDALRRAGADHVIMVTERSATGIDAGLSE